MHSEPDRLKQDQVGLTVRSKCGKGRISYQPDWSPSLPWATIFRGTAGAHFYSFRIAQRRLEEKGCRF